MEATLGIAAVIGIAPAMALMYLVLRKYTYPAVEKPFFSDPIFFSLFVVGMVAGTVLFAVYTYFWGAALLNAILFAVLETMVILVVLNLKRFHYKSDTVFYGYGIGLGLGATMSMGMAYYLMKIAGTVDPSAVFILTVMSVSKTFLLGAAGLNVGEAIAKLRIVEFTSQAMIANIVYQLVLVPWFTGSGSFYSYLALALGFIISAAYFYKMALVTLPSIVRTVLKQEGRKRNDIPK